MKTKKRFLLNHTLISGTTVITINDYYKKLTYYTSKYYKLINKRDSSSIENEIENDIAIEEEQNKTFRIYNTGTAFYGCIKWLVYKNLLINNDGNQHDLIISNRHYDHPDFMEMRKRVYNKIINLYNNFIFVK